MNSIDWGAQAHLTWFACLRLDGLGIAIGGEQTPMLFCPHIDASGMRMEGGICSGMGLVFLPFLAIRSFSPVQSGESKERQGSCCARIQ